jgi:hypothetical protein
MKQIELSAGTIEYQDTGGDGAALVLSHGLMMDASPDEPARVAQIIRDFTPAPVIAPCNNHPQPASGATPSSVAKLRG